MDWRGSSRSTEKRSHFAEPKVLLVRRSLTGWRTCSFSDFLPSGVNVCFVFEACTLWETCYPPYSIVLLFTWHASRSVDVASIKDRSGYYNRSVRDLRSTGRKFCKKLDAASWFESFFSLSLERQRSAGEMAQRWTYTGASVFDRCQKFCESAARLDGLANLRFGNRTTQPEIKR